MHILLFPKVRTSIILHLAMTGKTYHKRPTPGKPRAILPIDPHHARDNPRIVLPAMTQLMPPFLFDDLVGGNFVDGPGVAVGGVEEDGLEDVGFVGDGGGRGGVVLTELVLVVCAAREGC